jgi:hypothetical protein
LDTLWYTLDGGLTNISFTSNIGQINQQVWNEIWESSADGALILIRFFANDTLGHLGYQDVSIIVNKPDIFELNNPMLLATAGTTGGVLAITTISMKKSKKYKRMDDKQKKKASAILYLSILLTGLLAITSFI